MDPITSYGVSILLVGTLGATVGVVVNSWRRDPLGVAKLCRPPRPERRLYWLPPERGGTVNEGKPQRFTAADVCHMLDKLRRDLAAHLDRSIRVHRDVEGAAATVQVLLGCRTKLKRLMNDLHRVRGAYAALYGRTEVQIGGAVADVLFAGQRVANVLIERRMGELRILARQIEGEIVRLQGRSVAE